MLLTQSLLLYLVAPALVYFYQRARPAARFAARFVAAVVVAVVVVAVAVVGTWQVESDVHTQSRQASSMVRPSVTQAQSSLAVGE